MQKIKISTPQSWAKTAVALFAASALIVSCSDKDENEAAPVVSNTDVETVSTPSPRTLSIRASFKGDGPLSKKVTFGGTNDAPTATGTFEESEKIYVYNVTRNAMNSDESNYLSPSKISNDGKTCTLTGSLTGEIAAGDQIKLLYNMNGFTTYSASYCSFEYRNQGDDIIDGGISNELTVSSTADGNLVTAESAEIEPCQSQFRFKFVDDENNAINVTKIQIDGYSIAGYYYPLNSDIQYGTYQVIKTLSAATTNYVNVSAYIVDDYKTSKLTFTVTDENGDTYKGDKSAPASGFANGKYYFNAAPIQLAKQAQRVIPTITWTNVYTNKFYPKPTIADGYDYYIVYGPEVNGNYTNFAFTISGTSNGIWFSLSNTGGTVTLSGVNATYEDNHEYLNCNNYDLTLDIQGENTITCTNHDQAVCSGENLKLKGNGTLTVTVNGRNEIGLRGLSNYNYVFGEEKNVSNLAADGYTVSVSEMTDNNDGTYTWTYTVSDTNP